MRAARLALAVVASAVFVSMGAAAIHDVSKAWDVWYYHMPFAARIAGLVDARTYTFSATNEVRFAGFPLFAEALQGLAWRLTGRPESANLVAFASVPILAFALRRGWGVPLPVAFLAFVAIPCVMIQATSSYVDLFANALAAVLVLGAFRLVVTRAAPTLRELVLLALAAAGAANSKFQIVPVVVLSALVVAARALAHRPRRGLRALVLVGALPLVLATPLKNTVVHGNPVWPVELRVLGASLPSVETAYGSSPDWLEDVPRPARFVASVLELRAHPLTERRWSIDQWTPPGDPTYRMGGFFGAYVVVNVAGLALAVARRRSREAKVAGAFALGLTAVVSVLPQSHELRYYMVWMLVLVALNLVLWAREAEVAVGVVALASLAIVAYATGGTYLWPSGDSFASLVASKVDRSLVERAPKGTRVCLAREPWTFLYAPRFHPGATWTVLEAVKDEDCPRP